MWCQDACDQGEERSGVVRFNMSVIRARSAQARSKVCVRKTMPGSDNNNKLSGTSHTYQNNQSEMLNKGVINEEHKLTMQQRRCCRLS